jgi:putative endonuclease
MSKLHIELGRSGEERATNFLQCKGYNIISTNYRNKLGQIDIIAKDKDTICFVEVKTRNTLRLGKPEEAVEPFKQSRISRVALMYLKHNKLTNSPARFDVVSISCINRQPRIKLIKNAFELDYHYLY